MRLPIDLHVEFFKHLSLTTSAGLGLTCKYFYEIHWSLHGKVPLESCDPKFSVLKVDTTLGGLIQEFMAPLALDWCRGKALFVPVEKLGAREKRLREAEEEMDRNFYNRLHFVELKLREDMRDFQQRMDRVAQAVQAQSQFITRRLEEGMRHVDVLEESLDFRHDAAIRENREALNAAWDAYQTRQRAANSYSNVARGMVRRILAGYE